MEPHKERVLLRFLERSRRSMEECVAMLRAFAKGWMDAYYYLDPKWGQDVGKFAKVMIRDGCFMLEVLQYSRDGREGTSTCYATNDPIFSNHGKLHMMSYITRDMLMLENQLPMSLLVQLLSIDDQETKEKAQRQDYLIRLIVQFCAPRNGHPYEYLAKKQRDELKDCKHILDVFRKLLIFGNGSSNSPDQTYKPPSDQGLLLEDLDILPSATRLHDSGITIRKSNTSSITDITFECGFLGGVLKIPQIVVDDTTESVFLNLMAFERFHVGIGCEVTSYISFMDDIIDNQRDVSLLHTHQIVENAFGSDKAVAELFNSLTKDTTLDPASPLSRVRCQAKNQCNRRWNRWWGDFIHTYFINPWSIIAFAAAILFFGLDMTNTIFSIRDDLSDMPK